MGHLKDAQHCIEVAEGTEVRSHAKLNAILAAVHYLAAINLSVNALNETIARQTAAIEELVAMLTANVGSAADVQPPCAACDEGMAMGHVDKGPHHNEDCPLYVPF